MREVTVKLYHYDELSESAKEKVLEHLSDINVDYDWWDSIEDDAEQIGLDITEFDLYHRTIKGKFLISAEDVANTIIKNHGDKTETYKTASAYLDDLSRLRKDCNNEKDLMDGLDDEPDTEELDKEFLHSLLQDYLIMLQKDYDYLTSKEAIIETVNANEYEFREDGRFL